MIINQLRYNDKIFYPNEVKKNIVEDFFFLDGCKGRTFIYINGKLELKNEKRKCLVALALNIVKVLAFCTFIAPLIIAILRHKNRQYLNLAKEKIIYAHYDDLPQELKTRIFSFLPFRDMNYVFQTSKKWKSEGTEAAKEIHQVQFENFKTQLINSLNNLKLLNFASSIKSTNYNNEKTSYANLKNLFEVIKTKLNKFKNIELLKILKILSVEVQTENIPYLENIFFKWLANYYFLNDLMEVNKLSDKTIFLAKKINDYKSFFKVLDHCSQRYRIDEILLETLRIAGGWNGNFGVTCKLNVSSSLLKYIDTLNPYIKLLVSTAIEKNAINPRIDRKETFESIVEFFIQQKNFNKSYDLLKLREISLCPTTLNKNDFEEIIEYLIKKEISCENLFCLHNLKLGIEIYLERKSFLFAKDLLTSFFPLQVTSINAINLRYELYEILIMYLINDSKFDEAIQLFHELSIARNEDHDQLRDELIFTLFEKNQILLSANLLNGFIDENNKTMALQKLIFYSCKNNKETELIRFTELLDSFENIQKLLLEIATSLEAQLNVSNLIKLIKMKINKT